MTEQTDAAEVETALLSVTWPGGGRDGMPTRKIAQMLAPAVLDLLAAREAAARAEALREAADAIYLNRPGQHNEGAKNWLHRRANLIDPRTRGSVCEHGYSRSVGCDYCDATARIARTDGAGS